MPNFCTVCLKNSVKPLQVDRTLKRHQILITNLQKSVPEVEWPETVSICTQCLKRLKQVIAFRDLCISSYLKLKESPPSEVRLEQPPGGCIQGPEALPIDKEPEPIHVEKKQPENVRKTDMCRVRGHISITNLQQSAPEVSQEWPQTASMCTTTTETSDFTPRIVHSLYLKPKEKLKNPSELRLEQPPGGCIQGPKALTIDKDQETEHADKKQPEDVPK